MFKKGERDRRLSSMVRGFSLVELLVALAVAAIGLAIAIPSFTGVIVSNQLTATANELVASLNAARLQAIKRNNDAEFCSGSASANGSDTLGSSGCNAQATRVAALTTTGTASTVREAIVPPGGITLGTGANGGTALAPVRYSGNGLGYAPGTTSPYTGLVADVFTARISSDNHRCIYLTTGSVISSCIVTATTGGCPSSEPTNCQN